MTGNCYLESTVVNETRSLRHVRITYPGQVSVKHMVQWASHDPHAYLSCDKDWVKEKTYKISNDTTRELM